MKHLKLYLLLAICMPFWAGCSDDEETPDIRVNTNELELALEAGEASIQVSSNMAWTATTDNDWCVPQQNEGEGSAELKLTYTENLGRAARTAHITVATMDGSRKEVVTLTQKGPEALTDDYHYRLPVVFHVIYADKNNENQYVREGWLEKVLEACNELYRNSGVDLGLELVMATEDPDGRKLEEPGVNRVQWDISEISCQLFMGLGEYMPQKYVDLIWDPDRYINICLYNFSEDGVLGISHFPYVIKGDHLEGASEVPYEPTAADLDYPHCVSVNSLYVYDHQEGVWMETDVVSTITHELGHYLGLCHTFSEDDDLGTDSCIDSDYCSDTPTYNRDEYNSYVTNYFYGLTGSFTMEDFKTLVKRKDCLNGYQEFTSDNIMDYSFSYNDTFTPQQAARIRYVLLHSPFVPGPKYRTAEQTHPQTRAPFKFEKKVYE